MTSPRPAPYTEAHSALNGALRPYLLAPAAAETACLIAGVAFGQPWFFVIMGWLIVPMIWFTLAYRNWPTGIRLDEAAVSIGVLASPFMRAALVIDVDPAAVTASRIRPARFYDNYLHGYFSRLTQPRLSPVWVAPTRHPEALRKAIDVIPVLGPQTA